MKLRDTFMLQEPARPASAQPRLPLGVMKEALAGVGDPTLRQAQDFLWGMGVGPALGADGIGGWRPSIGDEVEFILPNSDGMRRAGRVHEIQGRDAIIQVNAGEYNFVPLVRLAPKSTEARRHERRAAIQQAIRGGGGFGALHETRSLIPVGSSGTDFAMTLEFSAGKRPSADDVDAYVGMHYPQARIADGDDSHPGKLGLVLSFPNVDAGTRALTASRGVVGQMSGPAEPPSSRDNAVGIGTEEIEGTGRIADGSDDHNNDPTATGSGEDFAPLGGGTSIISTEKKSFFLDQSGDCLHRIAESNPDYDFVETSFEETSVGVLSHFEVRRQGRRCFVREGQLTTTLAEGVVPAIGTIAVSDAGVTAYLAHERIADYDAGQGPLSMHENEPGANESGSYVIKADGVTGDMGGGPGGPQAVPVPGMPQHGDFGQDGKLQLKDMDYRREKERYELQQQEQAKEEARAKQRRLERTKVKSPMPGAPGQQIYTGELVLADATSPATEEDGDVREHIGGPGLHMAVDETAKDYYEGYFGDYGEKLTEPVDKKKEAERCVAMIHAAWREAGREDPSAEEVLYVLGVLEAPLAWDASHRVADQFDDLAQKLLGSANVSGQAKQQLQQMISKEIAKADPQMAKRFRANDPAVMQKMLPQLLRTMDPKALDKLTYSLAPGEASGQQPGWMSRNVFNRGREKTRNQIQKGLELEQTMGGGQPGAPGAGAGAGAPAAAPSGGGQPAGAGAGAGAGGSMGVVPAGGIEVLVNGQPQQIPQGTKLIIPGGVKGTPPGQAKPSQPAAPSAPAAGPAAPAAPTAPAQPAQKEEPLDLAQYGYEQEPQQQQAPAQPSQAEKPQLPPFPGPEQGQQPRAGSSIQIPKGTMAFDTDKKKQVAVRSPIEGRVLQAQENGDTLVQTKDGRILYFNSAGGGSAQASLHRRADAATDAYAGRRPPALNQLRFRMEGLARAGDYLVASIVWDAESTKAMAPASVVHNLKHYVKQRAGEKEFIDLGFIGRPVIENMDLEMGLAQVRFRSSEARVGPQETIQREDAAYHELA